MGPWKKKIPLTLPNGPKLQKRIQRLDSADLLEHIDLQFASLHRIVEEYHHSKDSYLMGEAMLATEAIYVMAEELEIRRKEAEEAVINRTRQPARGY